MHVFYRQVYLLLSRVFPLCYPTYFSMISLNLSHFLIKLSKSNMKIKELFLYFLVICVDFTTFSNWAAYAYLNRCCKRDFYSLCLLVGQALIRWLVFWFLVTCYLITIMLKLSSVKCYRPLFWHYYGGFKQVSTVRVIARLPKSVN